MNSPIRMTVAWPPSLNRLYRVFRGRSILSREGRAYKAAVERQMASEGRQPASGPLSVTAMLYRPRRSGDIDNSLKALLDSLTGYVWEDDRQIEALHVWRMDDKANPRVELIITGI